MEMYEMKEWGVFFSIKNMSERSIQILDGTDFPLSSMQTMCLVGPPGTGKTTLLKKIQSQYEKISK